MPKDPFDSEFKSPERLAFEIYLRTGRRLASATASERKFNPYHDPRNGQFTFAPGGPKSNSGRPAAADHIGLWKPKPKAPAPKRSAKPPPSVDFQSLSGDPLANPLRATLGQPRYRPSPRARMGGNQGPPLEDPRTLQDIIPELRSAPSGLLIPLPAIDDFLDITGAARAATAQLYNDRVKGLIREIQSIDPDYHYQSLGPVRTAEGRINEINGLRFERALAYYRFKGEERPLQLEVARFIQAHVDAAYERALPLYEAGRLPRGLSRNHAIGNYIDVAVRRELQERFNTVGIDHRSGPIRVIGRQYNTSKTEPTYVVPDARVERGDYDWTLQEAR